MMTWKQKCEEERFYEVRKWTWNSTIEEYDITATEDLTFEEAKEMFDSIDVGVIHDQVDIYREYSPEYMEKIALKCTDYETWDRDEM